MPTPEFQQLLYRELARANTRGLREIGDPLLTELVNDACFVMLRCQAHASGRINVDVAPLMIYRHMVELTDAIQVLLSESCVVAAAPLLRGSFESLVGLSFIVSDREAYDRRSLAWLFAEVRDRLAAARKHDPARPEGKQYARLMVEALGSADLLNEHLESTHQQIEMLEREHARDYYNAPRAEMLRLGKHGRRASWWELAGEPRGLRGIAVKTGWEFYYENLHRTWSGVVHGRVPLLYLALDEENDKVGFVPVRNPDGLSQTINHAATFMLAAKRKMIDYFRDGESMTAWYVREVMANYRAVWAPGSRKVDGEILAEE